MRKQNYNFPPAGSREAEDLLKRYVSENKTSLAKELGYSKGDSLYHAFNRVYGYRKGDQFPKEIKNIEIIRKIEKDVALERAISEARYYRSLYSETIKKIGLQELITSTMKDMTPLIPTITVKTSERDNVKNTDKGSESDVLVISDLHAGEIVDPEQTMGLSQYNMTIMNRRLGMLFKKSLDLVNLRRSALYIPNLVIPQLGDMLSGDIHPELVRTNISNMMSLSVRTAFILAQGIAYLSPHFDRIDIPCIPGNHARLYQKVYYKDKYVNWDYMVYQWEASFCRGLPNVKFDIPKSPFHLVNVEKTRILLMHGDSIKSWMGIPWYGIERAIFRMRELFQGSGDFFDAVILGHFHQRSDMDKVTGPIIVNGSVKGGDEFSIGSMQTSNRPSQNLLHFHDKHGYIGGGPVWLAGADDREDIGFNDFLTDTWAELEYEVTKGAERNAKKYVKE